MKKKNILITGAAGFIGYHLARGLHARGDKVIGLDNFNEYYDPRLKYSRCDLLKADGIEVLQGDICDFSLLDQLVNKHKITHIAHLAAQAGVRYSLDNPQAYVKTNLEGFVNILEICRCNPGIALTYASSSSVYGLNEKAPFSEQDRVDNQASLYGATKKSNELFAFTYHHLFQIPVTGLRFFTVYGPWGRPDMAYFSFTKNILEGQPINVFNHGKMQRDFTYIDDIISGTIAAIDKQGGCDIFNLGNHQPIALARFIELIERAAEKKAIINYLPMQPGDVHATYADISHSQKQLGFHPTTSLEKGIPLFVEWYKTHHFT
jgi:UDP-glucuronate 4-epimerase